MISVYKFQFDQTGAILFSDAPFYKSSLPKIGDYFPLFEDLESIIHLKETPIPAYEFEFENQSRFLDFEFEISEKESTKLFDLTVVDRSSFYKEFQHERSIKNQSRILNDILNNKCTRLENKINSLNSSINQLILEIGSPSGNIKSLLQLMLGNFESNIRNTEKFKNLIINSASEAEKVNTFISKLSEINKITSGSTYQRLDYCSIKSIVEEANSKVRETEKFKVNFDPESDFEIYVNRNHFVEIVKKIIYHSKSRSPDKDVTLNIYANLNSEKKSVELVFHDNGKYLNEYQQSKIFDIFYKTETDDEPDIKGLALVKHISNIYNGELTLKSVKRTGVKITILFKDILPRRVDWVRSN